MLIQTCKRQFLIARDEAKDKATLIEGSEGHLIFAEQKASWYQFQATGEPSILRGFLWFLFTWKGDFLKPHGTSRKHIGQKWHISLQDSFVSPVLINFFKMLLDNRKTPIRPDWRTVIWQSFPKNCQNITFQSFAESRIGTCKHPGIAMSSFFLSLFHFSPDSKFLQRLMFLLKVLWLKQESGFGGLLKVLQTFLV